MTNNVRERSIDDLELSVKTSGVLQSLGVKTVGDLLDRSTIPAPNKLVAAELTSVLDGLGVEYAGTIEVSLSDVKLRATGDVAARWKAIANWLEAEHPDALEHFNPPAAPEAVAAAEEALGETLPDDYKRFLLLHNGQKEFAPMVGLGSLLPIESVAEARQNISAEEEPIDQAYAGGPPVVGEGVRAVNYCEKWIPISLSARNRDYLCIDLDPAPGGVRGQIIEYVVDFPTRRLIARSFADLLSLYFEKAQSGELDLDEEIA